MRMAARTLRQGLRFIGRLSNGAPSREVVPGSRFRASTSEESGLRSSVVVGLVFCTTSGSLFSEQLHGRNERDHIGEGFAAEGSSVEKEGAPTTPPGDRDDIVENRVPIGRVSNTFALSGASLPGSAASADSPSSRGGCLNRFAIADAAAKAAPAVVNIKVSVGCKNLMSCSGRKLGGNEPEGRTGFEPVLTTDKPEKRSIVRLIEIPCSFLCHIMDACCTGRNRIFGESAGSGFIIKSDGTIVTNAHVIYRHGFSLGSLTVTLQDGRNFKGEVVDFDALSDLAVIKVNSSTPLPVVKLGTSKDLRPGEWVVALGSPLHLQNSVTAGIISCVDRKSAEIGLEGVATAYIQTDAAINQGNSGGPLINLDGEVIGINTMKALTADGVSFAIPIDAAFQIMDQLKKRRRVIRPWLGMKMLKLTEPRILQLKERTPGFPDVTAGILVSQVIPGSPASRAGVHNDDVITEFDGVPVSSIIQIVEALGDKVGTSFKMVVKRRNNEEVVLYVTAEEATP